MTKQLKIEVQAIMTKDGHNNPFTDDKPRCDGLHGFMKCHPQIVKCVPQTISTAQASVTKEFKYGSGKQGSILEDGEGG